MIDYASQDRTVYIEKEFTSHDSRIVLYLNEHNIGVSKTRNKGISIAKGQWLAFLDSDDCWSADKLQKQLCIREEYKTAEFIFTGSRFMDESGHLFRWIMTVPDNVVYERLLKQNVISCSSVLISKKCLGDHRMSGDSIHEDFALWLAILKEDVIAYGINEPLLIYRVSTKSKSGNKIKSAIMTYKTYLKSGIGCIRAFYYMTFYLFRSFIKYHNLYKSGYMG